LVLRWGSGTEVGISIAPPIDVVREPARITPKASHRPCRSRHGTGTFAVGTPGKVDGVAAPHKLDGLIAWTRREEWREPLAHCLDRHTAKVCTAAGIDPAEIEDLLGAYAASTVWGAAFEDLLATDLPDGRNLAHEYLRRRG
jgi:hypothetical protein